MQLRQVEYFVALCDELHFTRAAKRCRVSQPSLTNAMMALETEFGGPLFYRKPFVQLTALGEAVRPHLTRVLLNVDGATDAANALRSRQQVFNGPDICIDAIAEHPGSGLGGPTLGGPSLHASSLHASSLHASSLHASSLHASSLHASSNLDAPSLEPPQARAAMPYPAETD